MGIQLTSSAFAPGEPIPRQYTGEGQDCSPPLAWTGLPEGTGELALICDDPDAPTPEAWVHWVIYKIPPDTTELPEGVAKTAQLSQPPGAVQGKNSWPSGQTIGYRGPMPPPGHGVHRYYFRLYALDTPLDVPPGATKAELLQAMEGHILAQGELMGTYQR
ncbi:MAG TPA: YbhB/YbcL family Raf kinase inhibitor-like protein [Planctomycetaceae bacterium]|nr:YbhB/YbcL family Raf kinase inhibitor-like protein [Planctomycetaceae bacterium]